MGFTEERKEYFQDREELIEANRIQSDIKLRGIANITEHELADAAVTLAVYLVNIGQMYSELEDLAVTQKIHYEDSCREEYLSLKKSGKNMTDTMANRLAEDKFNGLKKQYLATESLFGSIKRYYKDIERLVSASQSRTKLSSADMARSGV